MPSFAELMFQQASDSAKQGIGDIAGASASGTKMGAEIAQHIEQAQQQRQELELKKQDLELAKVQHYVNAVQVGANMPEGPARNDYLKNRLPSLSGALGIDKMIPPQSQSFLQKDPNIAAALQEKVKNQELDPAAAISIAADPDQLAKFAGSDDYKKYVAMKKLDQPGDVSAATAAAQRASPPSDTQVTAAKNALVSRLQRNGMTGGISYADLQAAQNDPAKMQSFLQNTGLDKLGGEAALQQVMETYPKAIAEADAKGTADERALKVAAMRVSPIETRNKNQVVQDAQKQINNDTLLKVNTTMADTAIRAKGLINAAMKETDPKKKIARTKQLMGILSTEQAKLASGKNNFSEGSEERVAYENSSADLNNVITKYSSLFKPNGEVIDTTSLNAALTNADKEITELGGSYKDQMFRRLDTVGDETTALPEQIPIFRNKKNLYHKQYDNAFGDSGSNSGQSKFKLPDGNSYTAQEINQIITNKPELKSKIDPQILKAAGVK